MISLYLLFGVVLANLPWLGKNIFFVLAKPKKTAFFTLLEWLVYFFIFLGLGLGLENKINGTVHAQDWEFYAVMVLMFMVFSIPGVIYQRNVKPAKKVVT